MDYQTFVCLLGGNLVGNWLVVTLFYVCGDRKGHNHCYPMNMMIPQHVISTRFWRLQDI